MPSPQYWNRGILTPKHPTVITAPFVALNPLQTPVSISVSLCIHPSHTEESAVPVGQLFIFLHTNTGGKCLPSCQQVNRNPHPPSGRGEACSTLPAQVRAAIMIQLQDVMFYKQFHHMHMNAFLCTYPKSCCNVMSIVCFPPSFCISLCAAWKCTRPSVIKISRTEWKMRVEVIWLIVYAS